MSAYKIDHVGVAVASIDEALPVYRALGLDATLREEVPTQKVRTAMLPLGESRIELIEPTAQDSSVARFLARRGGGVHHICLAVDDIQKAINELSARGFRLLHTRPVAGADGKRVAFLHPEAAHGVLIELSQDSEKEPG